jgi:hypothetical protein
MRQQKAQLGIVVVRPQRSLDDVIVTPNHCPLSLMRTCTGSRRWVLHVPAACHRVPMIPARYALIYPRGDPVGHRPLFLLFFTVFLPYGG